MSLKPMLKGALTFIPGVLRFSPAKGTGGTDSASYCYGVWLKHLVMLRQSGLEDMPRTLAELGPGDSLGVGLAALLSGVERYNALDVVRHSNTARNLRIFDDLVALFSARAPRPDKGWPDYDAYLDDRLFPSHILTQDRLAACLAPERVRALREAVANPGATGGPINYRVPWQDAAVLEPGSVDLIISHSVLEHVADLHETYRALHAWLKPGGMMSHQIDFESHGMSRLWNGYRGYSEFVWKIILGKRIFLLNRQPYSVHAGLMRDNGFEILRDLQNHRQDGIGRSELASGWVGISDDDLTCAGAFVQARKPD